MTAGILFDRPAAWGKGWSLYRRTEGTDRHGNPTAVYPETPDYTAQAGSTGGVAWQVEGGSAQVTEPGERVGQAAFGLVYDDALTLVPFDRVAFDGAFWEIRAVQPWGHHRRVEVVRL